MVVEMEDRQGSSISEDSNESKETNESEDK